MECLRSLAQLLPRAVGLPRRTLCALALGLTPGTRPVVAYGRATELLGRRRAAPLCWSRRLPVTGTAVPALQSRDARLAVIPGADPTARAHVSVAACPAACSVLGLWVGPWAPSVCPLAQVCGRSCVHQLRTRLSIVPWALLESRQPSVLPTGPAANRAECACEDFESFAPIHRDSAETKIRLIYLE